MCVCVSACVRVCVCACWALKMALSPDSSSTVSIRAWFFVSGHLHFRVLQGACISLSCFPGSMPLPVSPAVSWLHKPLPLSRSTFSQFFCVPHQRIAVRPHPACSCDEVTHLVSRGQGVDSSLSCYCSPPSPGANILANHTPCSISQ